MRQFGSFDLRKLLNLTMALVMALLPIQLHATKAEAKIYERSQELFFKALKKIQKEGVPSESSVSYTLLKRNFPIFEEIYKHMQHPKVQKSLEKLNYTILSDKKFAVKMGGKVSTVSEIDLYKATMTINGFKIDMKKAKSIQELKKQYEKKTDSSSWNQHVLPKAHAFLSDWFGNTFGSLIGIGLLAGGIYFGGPLGIGLAVLGGVSLFNDMVVQPHKKKQKNRQLEGSGNN